jgi:hypothetical protein
MYYLESFLIDLRLLSNIKSRHCEARSNPKQYRSDQLIGNCFAPRNDVILTPYYQSKVLLCIANCLCMGVPVSRKASGESGQNNGGLERKKGHSYFLQKRGKSANAVGQNLADRGSARFAGQRPSGGCERWPQHKEAYLLT